MHIPDGFLSPSICAVTAAASVGGMGPALALTQRSLGQRTAPVMGMMAAFVFAAQMINFPIPGATSGHLLGGVLSAVMLGPWGGMLVISVVLVVQALLFADGGVTALGANILNMAVIGSGLGYLIYAPVRRLVGGLRGVVVGAMVSAWLSVVVSAIVCSVELAASGGFDLPIVLNAMLISHAYIGVGEAAITGLVLSALVSARPDLVYGAVRLPGRVPVEAGDKAIPAPATPEPVLGGWAGVGQFAAAGLAAALVTAVFVSPFASRLDDGLEAAAKYLREDHNLPLEEAKDPVWTHALFPDYNKPKDDEEPAAKPTVTWAATSFAGGIGTLVVFGLAIGLGRGVAGRGEVHVAGPA